MAGFGGSTGSRQSSRTEDFSIFIYLFKILKFYFDTEDNAGEANGTIKAILKYFDSLSSVKKQKPTLFGFDWGIKLFGIMLKIILIHVY